MATRPPMALGRTSQLAEIRAEHLVVVGDLHTEAQTLTKVLDSITPVSLKNGTSKIVLVGDVVSNVNEGDFDNFTRTFGQTAYATSQEYLHDAGQRGYELLMRIAVLINQYPQNVLMLPGNAELGITTKKASARFYDYLMAQSKTCPAHGDSLLKETLGFVNSFPFFVLASTGPATYLISHGGVAKTAATRTLADLFNFQRPDFGDTATETEAEERCLKIFKSIVLASNPTLPQLSLPLDGFAGQIFGHIHLFDSPRQEWQNLGFTRQTARGIPVTYATRKNAHVINSLALSAHSTWLEVIGDKIELAVS
ncbi:MAG: metallophosphoesterase [Candidatus Margulisiibacteriota bacterium]